MIMLLEMLAVSVCGALWTTSMQEASEYGNEQNAVFAQIQSFL